MSKKDGPQYFSNPESLCNPLLKTSIEENSLTSSFLEEAKLNHTKRLELGNRFLVDTSTSKKVSEISPKKKKPNDAVIYENKKITTSNYNDTPSVFKNLTENEEENEKMEIESDEFAYAETSTPIEVDDYDFNQPLSSSGVNENGFLDSLKFADYEKIIKDEEYLKAMFLRIVTIKSHGSSSLIESTNESRISILKIAEKITQIDPEFILKMALYLRLELNVRSTCYLLLAFGSLNDKVAPFLSKYYSKCILTPMDWLAVPDMVLSLLGTDETYSLKKGSLPTCLRKLMIKKFIDFNEYQLAKYSSKGIKKTKKRIRPKKQHKIEDEQIEEEDEENEDVESCSIHGSSEDLTSNTDCDDSFSDMDTINSCDSSDSDNNKDEESIPNRKSTLNNAIFEERKYNLKRMIRYLHIKEPQELVMKALGKKYPMTEEEFKAFKMNGYFDSEMAGHRMKLEIPKTWEVEVSTNGSVAKVWEDLIDHGKLSYLVMLRNIKNITRSGVDDNHLSIVCDYLSNEKNILKSKIFPSYYNSANKAMEKLTQHYSNLWSKASNSSTKKKLARIAFDVRDKIYDVIYEATVSSIRLNAPFFRGTSIIVVNMNDSMGIKVHEKISRLFYSCVVSSENPIYIAVLNGVASRQTLSDTKFYSNILSTPWSGCDHQEPDQKSPLDTSLVFCLKKIISKINNIIIIYSEDFPQNNLNEFIEDYRLVKNPDLLAVTIGMGTDKPDINLWNDYRNVQLRGYSELNLNIISKWTGGGSGHMAHLESIDKRFGLRKMKTEDCSWSTPIITSWKKVKLFISSTFLDMKGERDLMNYVIVPELRRRCRQIGVELIVVDLRWGLPSGGDHTDLALLCLKHVQTSDLFVSFLGERYGWKPVFDFRFENSELVTQENIERLKSQSISITELEISYAFGRIPQFYFFRNPSLVRSLPEDVLGNFVEMDDRDSNSLNSLKEKICSSGEPVYLNYDGRFNGVGFGDFGDLASKIIESLWTGIRNIKGKENMSETAILETFIDGHDRQFIGREKELKDLEELSFDSFSQIIHVYGNPGIGTTSFLCKITQILRKKSNSLVIPYFGQSFIGNNLELFLKFMSKILSKIFGIEEVSNSALTENKISSLIQNIKIPVIFIVDGTENHSSHSWIPHSLFSSVKLIVSSSLENSPLTKALQDQHKKDRFSVRHFVLSGIKIASEKRKLAGLFFSSFGDKSAQNEKIMEIIALEKKFENPLYMKTVCLELVASGLHSHQLKTFLKSLGNTSSEIYSNILKRISNKLPTKLVKIVVSVLYYCPLGITLSILNKVCQKVLDLQTSKSSKKRKLLLPAAKISEIVLQLDLLLQPTVGSLFEGLLLIHKERVNERVFQDYLLSDVKTGIYETFVELYDNEKSDLMSEVSPLVLSTLIRLCSEKESDTPIHTLRFIYFAAKGGLLNDYLFFGEADNEFVQFIKMYIYSFIKEPISVWQTGINYHSNYIFPDLPVHDEKGIPILASVYPRGSWEVKYRQLSGTANVVAQSKNGLMALGLLDGTITVNSVEEGIDLFSLSGQAEKITALCFGKADEVLVTGFESGNIDFWDLQNKKKIPKLGGAYHTRAVTGILYMGASNYISVGEDRNILSINSMGILSSYRHSEPLSAVVGVSDCTIIAGSWRGEILFFDSSSGISLSQSVDVTNGSIQSIAVDEYYVLVSDINGVIALLDRSNGSVLRRVEIEAIPTKVEFVFDDQAIIGCSDGNIYLWSYLNTKSKNKYNDLKIQIDSFVPFSSSMIGKTFDKIGDISCLNKKGNEVYIGFDSGLFQIYDETSRSITLSTRPSEESLVGMACNDSFSMVFTSDSHNIFGIYHGVRANYSYETTRTINGQIYLYKNYLLVASTGFIDVFDVSSVASLDSFEGVKSLNIYKSTPAFEDENFIIMVHEKWVMALKKKEDIKIYEITSNGDLSQIAKYGVCGWEDAHFSFISFNPYKLLLVSDGNVEVENFSEKSDLFINERVINLKKLSQEKLIVQLPFKAFFKTIKEFKHRIVMYSKLSPYVLLDDGSIAIMESLDYNSIRQLDVEEPHRLTDGGVKPGNITYLKMNTYNVIEYVSSNVYKTMPINACDKRNDSELTAKRVHQIKDNYWLIIGVDTLYLALIDSKGVSILSKVYIQLTDVYSSESNGDVFDFLAYDKIYIISMSYNYKSKVWTNRKILWTSPRLDLQISVVYYKNLITKIGLSDGSLYKGELPNVELFKEGLQDHCPARSFFFRDGLYYLADNYTDDLIIEKYRRLTCYAKIKSLDLFGALDGWILILSDTDQSKRKLHEGPINDIVIVNDFMFATAGGDGFIKVWRCQKRSLPELVAQYEDSGRKFMQLKYSGDRVFVATDNHSEILILNMIHCEI